MVVLLYVRYPMSLRNVEDLLFERGYDLCHETVRLRWNRFGPMFAADIRRQRVNRMCVHRDWKWHLDEMYVKLNGEMVYLLRAVDHEGEVLESYVTKKRDKSASFGFIKKALKPHGRAETIVIDGLKFYPATMRELGNLVHREMGRWLKNRAENCGIMAQTPYEFSRFWSGRRLNWTDGTSKHIGRPGRKAAPVGFAA